MLLAVLLTTGFLGLLVVVGWLTDRLLGAGAERWARRIANGRDPDAATGIEAASDPDLVERLATPHATAGVEKTSPPGGDVQRGCNQHGRRTETDDRDRGRGASSGDREKAGRSNGQQCYGSPAVLRLVEDARQRQEVHSDDEADGNR